VTINEMKQLDTGKLIDDTPDGFGSTNKSIGAI